MAATETSDVEFTLYALEGVLSGLEDKRYRLTEAGKEAHRLHHEGRSYAADWRRCDAVPCAALAEVDDDLGDTVLLVAELVDNVKAEASP